MINISSILFFLSFRDGISHVIIMHLRLFTGFLPVWANCILTVLHRSVCQSQPAEWVSFARYLQPAILIQVTYFSLSDIWVWWWPVKLNQSCRAHNVDNKVPKWTLLHCPLHISMSHFPYWQHVLKYRLTLPEMSNINMLSSSDRVVYGASRCITVPQTSHTPIKRNRIQRYDKDMSVLPLRKTFITDWHFVFFKSAAS